MNPREQQTEGGFSHSSALVFRITVFHFRSKGIRAAFNRERVEHTLFNKEMAKFVMGVANTSRDLFLNLQCWLLVQCCG